MGFRDRAMLTYLADPKPFQNVTQPGPSQSAALPYAGVHVKGTC